MRRSANVGKIRCDKRPDELGINKKQEVKKSKNEADQFGEKWNASCVI